MIGNNDNDDINVGFIESLPLVTPDVVDAGIIFEYGIDKDDLIIKAVPPPAYINTFENTSTLPEIVYDNTCIPGFINSINRLEVRHLFGARPEVTIVSNRNLMRNIMASFMFPLGSRFHPEQFELVVEKRGDLIFFGILNQDPGTVSYTTQGQYGIPFENLITHVADSALCGFFRFNSYSISGVPLIVRSEIDCVNNANQYYELKSKKVNQFGSYVPENDEEYMRYIWCQMFLGKFHTKASDYVILLIIILKCFHVQVVLTRLFLVCTMNVDPVKHS